MSAPLRLFKASSYNAGALAAFYAAHPGLAGQSFARQRAALEDTLLVGTDFWRAGLAATGRFEVFETVLNARPLQEAWASEHGLSPAEAADPMAILLAQIEAFAPQVLFSHDFETLRPAFRRQARGRASSIRLVFGWDGIARNDPELFSGCDLMLSCIPHVADFYRTRGFAAAHFPYSFHEALAERLGPRPPEPSCPLLFAGSVQLKSNLHFQRADLLWRVRQHLPLTLHAGGAVEQWRWREAAQRRRLRHLRWREARMVHDLGCCNRGPLHGLAMFRALAEAGIVLNMHIDAARGQASNMRLFEATGAGACLLTDWQEDLPRYFAPGLEVETYRDAGELVEKAKALLADPARREAVAAAGRARTMRDHTFARRAGLLEGILREALANR